MKAAVGLLIMFVPFVVTMAWSVLSHTFLANAAFVLAVCLFPFCVLAGSWVWLGADKLSKFLRLRHD